MHDLIPDVVLLDVEMRRMDGFELGPRDAQRRPAEIGAIIR